MLLQNWKTIMLKYFCQSSAAGRQISSFSHSEQEVMSRELYRKEKKNLLHTWLFKTEKYLAGHIDRWMPSAKMLWNYLLLCNALENVPQQCLNKRECDKQMVSVKPP